MLGYFKVLLLLQLFNIFVECSYPSSLSVRKLNRQLVARTRQSTLDLCRMFNIDGENHDMQQRHKRTKRSASPMQDHAEKIENLVDKLYDEEEGGHNFTYRRMDIPTKTTATSETLKSGRRFDFAPGILEVDIKSNNTVQGAVEEGKTVPVLWHKYWKHGIVPYFIDSNTYDTFLADKITKAFDHFERSTCIRLQRLRERPTDKDSLQSVQWLYITNPSGTRQCVHSNEMKVTSGVQMVVFGYDCMSEGEILHEVMHILGFSHEHLREDRDQHISIMWDNIKPGYKKFFEIKPQPAILRSLPYDHASVLHYPPRAFSKNGKYTLVAQPGVAFGQRDGLSEIDIEKVSLVYGGECIERNKHYLVTTCPTVMASASKGLKATPTLTQQDIHGYFKDRLWPYGIVNYKLKDKIEFSIEERQNIEEVIKHIEKETCIEFRDLSGNDEDQSPTTEINAETADDGNQIIKDDSAVNELNNDAANDIHNEIFTNVSDTFTNVSDTFTNVSATDAEYRRSKHKLKSDKAPIKASRRLRRSVPQTPSRRHANDIIVLSRSPEPGCQCPEPGVPTSQQELVINADCFNSANELLHLFVHVLGLDHQHNMHDRDDYLAINWGNVTSSLRSEMEHKLPPAASVGFAYDYQSVMHYPWLDIKNGQTNIMYPIWNDGWAMGHWQGLSSVDVQKLNLLYFEPCQARKKHLRSLSKKY